MDSVNHVWVCELWGNFYFMPCERCCFSFPLMLEKRYQRTPKELDNDISVSSSNNESEMPSKKDHVFGWSYIYNFILKKHSLAKMDRYSFVWNLFVVIPFLRVSGQFLSWLSLFALLEVGSSAKVPVDANVYKK